MLCPYQEPELDIIAYLPKTESMSELDRVSHGLFLKAAEPNRPQQTHLATYVVNKAQLAARGIEIKDDVQSARIMRSVLMKPEHESLVPEMHEHVSMWARRALEPSAG